MNDYPIFIGENSLHELKQWILTQSYSRIMVLIDKNTRHYCYPKLLSFLPPHHTYCINAGEIHKNLRSCEHIWSELTGQQFDRKGLIINLGGGVIGDMGGFVAATYKRGIDFVQIPTTLLSQVDASVGGKLGIDFLGYKNHIGLFQEPQAVFIWPTFLKTLPEAELCSGFAEVIKHHLIADASAWQQLTSEKNLGEMNWEALIRHSVQIKSQIVASDFAERGNRKALNFGHTIGHAIESHRLGSSAQLLHGEAVAIGMIAEAYISHKQGLLSEEALQKISKYILHHFPKVSISDSEIPFILNNLQQDKKNVGGKVLCTLIEGPGRFQVDHPLEEKAAVAGIRYYCEN